MPLLDIHLQCPIHDSFRVQQVVGMFDLPRASADSDESPLMTDEHFRVEVPGLDEPWHIGAMVGPSGSGKTAVARAAFGAHLYAGGDWPADRAVIDCFGDWPIGVITHTLSAVGFSSPPAWLKPYAVLSNGQRFRCELARALLGNAAGPALVPSPLYSGERVRVRGGSSNGVACPKCSTNNPSPQPSPLSTRERGQESHPSRDAAMCNANVADTVQSLPLVVFDEFTSVVDRIGARFASAAVARAIRVGKIPRRLVAVTCHRDILPWLSPDWVIDMADGSLTRGRVRQPQISIQMDRADRSTWRLFQRHHYLSGSLHGSSQCFVGSFEGRPAAFTAVLPFPHPIRPGWREHRTVCLPDFQGVGIGAAMSEFVASLFVAGGKPYFSTTGHPAVIRHRARSRLWKMRRKPGLVSPMGRTAGDTHMGDTLSACRFTAGFEYVGPARVREARELGVSR